jgi:peptide/nickel transport system ATP-binding protein
MTEQFLETKNVSKNFRIGGLIGARKLAAVDQVNITIPKGKPQILRSVGESGSGKTTLARMILRLIQPSSGEIIVDGLSTVRPFARCATAGISPAGAAHLSKPL